MTNKMVFIRMKRLNFSYQNHRHRNLIIVKCAVIINNHFLNCSQNQHQGKFEATRALDSHETWSFFIFGENYILCECFKIAIEIIKRMVWHCGDIYYWTQFSKYCFSHVTSIVRTHFVYISLLGNKFIHGLAHSTATTLCICDNFLLRLRIRF